MSVSTGETESLDLRPGTGITTQAETLRWQPVRAGLVNVWRYWDETFTFHHGRLLLLGANGSGKSLGLELLLPFLFDANASPSRLTSAAKARGGLYDRMMAGYSGNTRAGFLWVEFAQADNYFTVGTRLRASQSTRKVDSDFFTTSQRVGINLHLLNQQREPLSVKLLKEAIAEHGAVHNTAQEHRQQVRRTLFKGFSEDRYDALITALLAMRKEKLSQHLDLRKMSDTLSQALTPLEEHDLATVAEGFERLDRRRKELESLDAELKVIRRLSQRRKIYAQHICASVANEVRRAETERDDVTRRQREATTRHEQTSTEFNTTKARLTESETASRQTEAQLEALQASEAYKSGAQLSDLQNSAQQLKNNAEREYRELERCRKREQAMEGDYQKTCKAYDQQLNTYTDSQFAVHTQVQKAGADLAVDLLPVPNDFAPATDAATEEDTIWQAYNSHTTEQHAIITVWINARREHIATVQRALDKVTTATVERDRQRSDVETEEATLEKNRNDLDNALKSLAMAEQQFIDDTNNWSVSCSNTGVERIRQALPDDITAPLVQASMAQLQSDITAEQAVQRNELHRNIKNLNDEIANLETERTELQSYKLQQPETPLWRDPRDNNTGRPLWAVLEPKPGLPDSTIDRLEAALTASGFLDAWLANDGKLHLQGERADIALTAAVPLKQSLSDVLLPSVDKHAALSADTIYQVLCSIALQDTALGDTEHDVVIGLDGTFKLGAASGRGRLQTAEFIGASARERRRLKRIQAIESEIQSLEKQSSALKEELQQLDRLALAIDAEFATQPSGASVDKAIQDERFHQRIVSDTEARVARLRIRLQEAENILRENLRQLTMLAAQHKLPADGPGLEATSAEVHELQSLTDEWRQQHKQLLDNAHRQQAAQAQLMQATADSTRAEQRHAESKEQAAEAQARFDTLNQAVGKDYQQLLLQSGQLKQQRDSLRVSIGEFNQSLQHLNGVLGTLNTTLEQVESDRQKAEEIRHRSHNKFKQLLVDRMTDDAQLEITLQGEAMTAVLGAARSVSQKLPELNADAKTIDEVRARQQEALHQANSQLGGHIDLDEHQGNDGWWILVANADGARLSISELSDVLADQLQAGRD